jgi:hypothetical protein
MNSCLIITVPGAGYSQPAHAWFQINVVYTNTSRTLITPSTDPGGAAGGFTTGINVSGRRCEGVANGDAHGWAAGRLCS